MIRSRDVHLPVTTDHIHRALLADVCGKDDPRRAPAVAACTALMARVSGDVSVGWGKIWTGCVDAWGGKVGAMALPAPRLAVLQVVNALIAATAGTFITCFSSSLCQFAAVNIHVELFRGLHYVFFFFLTAGYTHFFSHNWHA